MAGRWTLKPSHEIVTGTDFLEKVIGRSIQEN
jgi:hypothetical protein